MRSIRCNKLDLRCRVPASGTPEGWSGVASQMEPEISTFKWSNDPNAEFKSDVGSGRKFVAVWIVLIWTVSANHVEIAYVLKGSALRCSKTWGCWKVHSYTSNMHFYTGNIVAATSFFFPSKQPFLIWRLGLAWFDKNMFEQCSNRVSSYHLSPAGCRRESNRFIKRWSCNTRPVPTWSFKDPGVYIYIMQYEYLELRKRVYTFRKVA